MTREEAKIKAKKLYIEGKTVKEILVVIEGYFSSSTINRWIKDEDWEKAKKLSQISPEELGNILFESFKELILKIKENPEELKDPKVADSLMKVVSMIKSIKKDVDYLGVASDVIEEITRVITTEHQDLTKEWNQIIDKVFEALEKKWGK